MHDEAIREFLLRDHGRVVRAVAVVCGDRQRAEDAVQEALVDVWTKNREVDDLTGWVTTAALNRARSRWRTLAAERRAFDRLAAQSNNRPEASPSAVSDGWVVDALKELPRAQREVVALHYLLDLTVADVSVRLGIAEGTVKTHLHRARITLRGALVETTDRETASEHEDARHA